MNLLKAWRSIHYDARPQVEERLHFVAAIKRCTKTRNLEDGKKLHREAVAAGCHSDKYVAPALITMYSKCRSMPLAREVFEGMTHRNVVTWNCLIQGYVENGESAVALKLFASMNCEPTVITYLAVLKAASLDRQFSIEKRLAIHKQIKACGFDLDISVASSLVKMYTKCGRMQDAQEVFESMTRKDVVTWTCLILGYVENGEYERALDLFTTMECEPDRVTYVAALKACAGLASERESDKKACLLKGKAFHEEARERGFESDIVVGNTLVGMYSKCGSMGRAQMVFDGMVYKDVVTWNSLILGYVDNGESSVAIDLFSKMESEPTSITYVAVLKACSGLASEKESQKQVCLQKGMAFHEQVKKRGYDSSIVVSNTLVDMYAKCGSMRYAWEVFERMVRKDVVTWTSLILGYVENGESYVAMELFDRMDCEPNSVSYVAVLKACACLASDNESQRGVCLQKGMDIHEQVKKRGFDSNIVVSNTLLDMYTKCGRMERAKEVFDRMVIKDVVTWTCLILGYVENGENSVALDLFTSMDCEPDIVTYVAALKALASLVSEETSDKHGCLEKGMVIHQQVKDCKLDSDIVLSTALVDMYCKCGSMVTAREVFEGMITKDVVVWNSLVLGYVENGESSVAIEFLTRMDCEPDSVTYLAALKACGSLTALSAGRYFHARVCRCAADEVIATALVDFYGKCGCMNAAEEVFNCMQSRTNVSWTVLIAGYTSIGDSSQVFTLANEMTAAGVQMDSVTLTCILNVCSHAGLLEEGKMYFESMSRYGVNPSLEHYTCMVDMLGRANRSEEAVSILNSMSCKANSVTWRALLAACRKWKNVELGKVAFDALVATGTRDSADYVLMSDVYG